MVLKQFVKGLPARMAEWMRRHQPTRLEAAVTLAEYQLSCVHADIRKNPMPDASLNSSQFNFITVPNHNNSRTTCATEGLDSISTSR